MNPIKYYHYLKGCWGFNTLNFGNYPLCTFSNVKKYGREKNEVYLYVTTKPPHKGGFVLERCAVEIVSGEGHGISPATQDKPGLHYKELQQKS